MLPRWIRTLVVTAIALGVWLVAAPAFAASAAPLCDGRGAIMFAPTPTLQPPAASIDISDSGDDCFGEALQERAVQQGRTPSPPPPAFEADFVVPGEMTIAGAPSTRLSRAPLSRDGGPIGVRVRVDRPPRG